MAVLSDSGIDALLPLLPGWERRGSSIVKTYTFRDYGETMAFANAIAWIAQRQDHHPEVTIGHASCQVSYSTHVVSALTENDFICAAKLDALFLL